ncbi:hypothetical protein BABINDRAFT_171804 [Babjeviella inositovora NRRL Y-12698]|uniref:Carbon catabolite-derepressing protein kinase n=1 Tax=Babjeviella inositovora NRRL Y-12698 TaxID=984486 RepID=A0A1E3QMN8_9ASCO|nr:uncharacterized protein BABINDRAFT_171804 [Babjeviella inositovora NRRL Y-12698]ODQ78945.1 hypothetical protein BABINDRAFT_171804 [Babjeviella inositovora NRRL Y-12698]
MRTSDTPCQQKRHAIYLSANLPSRHKMDNQIPHPGVPADANPANRVGKYQIIKTLGEGSFGKVKLAYHLTTGQRVALKIINRKTLAKSDMQGRVEREISYLRLLRHPHIIKLYDVIKSNDEIIMVIEYAGKELFDYIVQTGKMEENEARRFFQQIIAAVEYCHRHKIVHRDLKPENLLLDENLNVKIADFGLSNIMTDGDFLKTSCGSPNYAAPEVISGKLYAGPEVDVWSCGVILYVMLCGRLPFDDEFIPELFKKISSGKYTLPSFLSPGAKAILQKMLVVNPLNRITVHEIMEDEWFKVNIAEYLLPPDLSKNEEQITADDDVIHALSVTMGYARDDILQAIALANRGKHNPNGEILDAYKLIRDNTRLVADLKKTKQLNMDSFLMQSPPVSNHQSVSIEAPQPVSNVANSTIAILPSSLPQLHRAYIMEHLTPEQQQVIQSKNLTPLSTKKSKTRWHFGIRSRSYPLDVMGEIYRALQNLGAEWSKPSEEELWTIRVRWKYSPAKPTVDADLDDFHKPEEEEEEPVSNTPDMMKMQIQLFQLEPNNYLVDFKFGGWEFSNPEENKAGVEGEDDEMSSFSAYPFLHMATRLIMELAVNSQGG